MASRFEGLGPHCGVIGHPIGHSLSPAIHNAAYAAAGLDYTYAAYDVTDVEGFLAEVREADNLRGLSVTIPHKLAVIPHLDEIDPMADRVGSVNTITHEDGRLIGSTTDGPGTLRAFEEAGASIIGKNVLFLGAGGAVRAVAFAFADAACPSITIAARSQEKAAVLAKDLSSVCTSTIATCTFADELTAAINQSDIIVQGTPVGMEPNANETLVPADLLKPDHIVFDMVYRPLETRLLRDARAAGCTTITGIEMLVHQAVLQFERWTGVPCPVEAMRGAALNALSTA